MLFLRGLFTLLTFLVQLFPMVLTLVKIVLAERERSERKRLVKELIEAQKNQAKNAQKDAK